MDPRILESLKAKFSQITQQPVVKATINTVQNMNPALKAFNPPDTQRPVFPEDSPLGAFQRGQYQNIVPTFKQQALKSYDYYRSPEGVQNLAMTFSPAGISKAPIPKPTQIAGKLKVKGQQLLQGVTDEAGNVLNASQNTKLPNLQGKLKVKPAAAQTGMQGDDILQSGYKEIGSLANAPKKTLTQKFDEFYTNWVDRFNPIVKAAERVEKGMDGKAMLRPEFNPKYTLKRFLGMGGIAEHRYNTELKPILSKLDEFQIPQKDMDLYLKSRRDINLGGRGIKGSSADLGIQRAGILEGKYGTQIKQIADELYAYQKKGFEELSQAGFLDPQTSRAIMTANADYVPFQRVMDKLDDYLGIPSRTAQQSVNPVKGIKGSDKQIYSPVESIIANTYKQRAAIEKNNVAKSIANLSKTMPEIGFYPTSKSGSSTIAVWENGQKVNYEVGEDIATAVKGLSEESMNSFLKVLTIPAQVLRTTATGGNPEFMIPNVIRDQFDAALNSKYGYVPFVDWAKGLSHLLAKDDVYQAWMNSGAAQTLTSMSGRDSVSKMLQSKTAKKKIIRRIFDWMGQGISTLGTYSEQPTRIGLFNRAYQKTGNPLISAMESREGTLDFARMGAKMKVANSIIPFLNVGIQGFDKMVRTAKNNPFQFAAKMAIYGTLPAAATTLYNTTYYPQEYAEIPQFVKDDNFVIVTGRNDKGTVNYITIPKGNVIKYITNPTENFISYLAGTNQQTLGEMAALFISSGLPVLGEGQSIQEIATKTIGSNLPQAIKPLTENLLNRSFYKYDTKDEEAKDIVPYYLNKKPAGERAYEFTPQVYQFMGRVLNTSPLQIQNLMEGYFAGYTKIPANIIETLYNIKEGNPVNQNQIPMLRRFVQETYPSASKVNNSEIDLGGGTKLTKNTERADVLSSASAAEGNTPIVTKIGGLNISTRDHEQFPFPDYAASAPGQVLRADLDISGSGKADIVFHFKDAKGRVSSVPQSVEEYTGQGSDYGLEMQIPKDASIGKGEVWATINGKEVQGSRKPHEVVNTTPVNRYRAWNDQGQETTGVVPDQSNPTFRREAAVSSKKSGKLTPDELIASVLSDNEVTALEKKQISNAVSQVNEEMDKIYESKMPELEKERELTRLDELKKRLQESDNKKKEPKTSYINVSLTGDPDIDKRIVSRQQEELTTAINETIDKYVRGELTQDQANKTIAGFKALKDALKQKSSAGKGGKKPKKLKITRMKAPAFRASKSKKIKTKKVKLPKIKLATPKKSEKVEQQYIPTL